jgi:hypothetical protein
MEESKENQVEEVVDLAGPEPISERENTALEMLAETLHWSEVGLALLSVIFVALGVLFLLGELLHFPATLRETALHTSFE